MNKIKMITPILAVLFMVGCAHTAYHVQMVGHDAQAESGNTKVAALVLAVNDANGPVTGLTIKNFTPATSPVPAFGCNVTITRVVSSLSGRYLLDVVPFKANPKCKWLKGDYAISILAQKDKMAGNGVTILTIKK